MIRERLLGSTNGIDSASLLCEKNMVGYASVAYL